MPPYRGDNTPAWGLHYGAPSGSGPVELGFFEILLGTVAFDPVVQGWNDGFAGACVANSADFGGSTIEPFFGAVYHDPRVVGLEGFTIIPGNGDYNPLVNGAAWIAANAANTVVVETSGAPFSLPVAGAIFDGSAVIWKDATFPGLAAIWPAGETGSTYRVSLFSP